MTYSAVIHSHLYNNDRSIIINTTKCIMNKYNAVVFKAKKYIIMQSFVKNFLEGWGLHIIKHMPYVWMYVDIPLTHGVPKERQVGTLVQGQH